VGRLGRGLVAFLAGVFPLAGGVSAAPKAPAARANLEGEAAKLHDVKELVFADDVGLFLATAEKSVGKKRPAAKAEPSDPVSTLATAWARKRKGDLPGARALVKQVLSSHPTESRVELLYWSAARELGEAPPEADAQRVLGVVVEVPQARGLDTLAAYADGRARYFNQAGGAVVWEKTEGDESDLAREVVRTAQAAVDLTPVVVRRTPYPGEVVRLTLLTPGGLRVKEGSFEEIGAGPLSPTLENAARLLRVLLDASLGPDKKPPPASP
jgi:hypothetical protein